MSMVRIALFLVCVGFAGVYLFKIEERSVDNGLVCQYQAEDLILIGQNHLLKFRRLLPEIFPEDRFKTLSSKIAKTEEGSSHGINCDSELNTDFRKSPLYDLRMALFPIYPSSLRTLAAIEDTLGEERRFISQVKILKKELLKEHDRFENFLQDCTRIRSFADQILLLKSHLKIEKRPRKPASSTKWQSTEFSMNRNISKQINYARKNLSENEKLFQYKWKIYLDHNFGKALCQY